MTRWRRLVRDYEERIDVSEAFIHIAIGSLLTCTLPISTARRSRPRRHLAVAGRPGKHDPGLRASRSPWLWRSLPRQGFVDTSGPWLTVLDLDGLRALRCGRTELRGPW